MKPGTDELEWNFAIIRNGVICARESFRSEPLQEGDELVLMPIPTGG